MFETKRKPAPNLLMTRKDALKYRDDSAASKADGGATKKRKKDTNEGSEALQAGKRSASSGDESQDDESDHDQEVAWNQAKEAGAGQNFVGSDQPHQSFYDLMYPWAAENANQGDGAGYGGQLRDDNIIMEGDPRLRTGHDGKRKSNPKGQSILYTGTPSAKKLFWTKEMDHLLREGVEKYGVGRWVLIAQHVGNGVCNNQCLNRWVSAVNPDITTCLRGPWTEEETKLLAELIRNDASVLLREHKNFTDCINWKEVGVRMNRTREDCKGKWRNVLSSTLKSGPFSPDEDALIRMRVTEWGNRGSGLWVALEKEMGRPGTRIRVRWSKIMDRK